MILGPMAVTLPGAVTRAKNPPSALYTLSREKSLGDKACGCLHSTDEETEAGN